MLNLLINIALALLSAIGAVALFGGDGWRKGPEPLIKRITARGYISIACVVGTFVLAGAHEYLAFQEELSRQKAETAYKAQLDATKAELDKANSKLDDAMTSLSAQRELIQTTSAILAAHEQANFAGVLSHENFISSTSLVFSGLPNIGLDGWFFDRLLFSFLESDSKYLKYKIQYYPDDKDRYFSQTCDRNGCEGVRFPDFLNGRGVTMHRDMRAEGFDLRTNLDITVLSAGDYSLSAISAYKYLSNNPITLILEPYLYFKDGDYQKIDNFARAHPQFLPRGIATTPDKQFEEYFSFPDEFADILNNELLPLNGKIFLALGVAPKGATKLLPEDLLIEIMEKCVVNTKKQSGYALHIQCEAVGKPVLVTPTIQKSNGNLLPDASLVSLAGRLRP
jgi:hypothetical protein